MKKLVFGCFFLAWLVSELSGFQKKKSLFGKYRENSILSVCDRYLVSFEPGTKTWCFKIVSHLRDLMIYSKRFYCKVTVFKVSIAKPPHTVVYLRHTPAIPKVVKGSTGDLAGVHLGKLNWRFTSCNWGPHKN